MINETVSAIVGGVAVVLVGHPFDTIKTRLQTAPQGYFSNTMDCVKQTYEKEGVKGFFNGIKSPLAGQMLYRAASFGTFHYTTTQMLSGRHGTGPGQLSMAELLLAGGATGFVISFIEAPMDLVKTKLQTQMFRKEGPARGSGGGAAAVVSAGALPSNMANTPAKYRGSGSGNDVLKAFGLLKEAGLTKNVHNQHSNNNSSGGGYYKNRYVARRMASGSIAFGGTGGGIEGSLVQHPAFPSYSSSNNTQMVSSPCASLSPTPSPSSAPNAAFTDTAGCIRYVLDRYGPRALFQGLNATILRNVPANAAFYPVNLAVKNLSAECLGVPVSELPVSCHLLAGSCAGLGYWVSTFPLDVIKARVQSAEFHEKLTWSTAAQRIYLEQGIKGFYRGLMTCAARAVPACAVMFTTVDFVRDHLNSST